MHSFAFGYATSLSSYRRVIVDGTDPENQGCIMGNEKTAHKKGMGGKLSIISRLRLLPRYLRDSSVALWRKGFLLLLLAYILSPVDAIPEILLPLIGWLDDVGVLGILIGWLYKEIGDYSDQVKEEQLLEASGKKALE